MAEGPPIEDQELLARLAMSQEEFVPYVRKVYGSLPAPEFEARTLAGAVEYPYARPDGPFHLEGGRATALVELAPAKRDALVGRFAHAGDRHPILAIGSNGSPQGLRSKFAHFEDPADREVLVLTGRLHDFDVGASPQPALYGAMPATLFPSVGARVRAALLWVTPAQLTQLAWSELNYRLGRLRTAFAFDAVEDGADEVLVFISRFGAFSPDGDPVALAAVPAEGRRAEALTQEQLLDRVAALVLGPGAGAEDLVRSFHADRPAVLSRVAERVWPLATAFESALWEPFPS